MNRRSFLASLAFSGVTSATALGQGGVFRRRRRFTRRAAAHQPWGDRTSVSILVGGRFSTRLSTASDGAASKALANVYQWHEPEEGNFYWEAHDRHWQNCYGRGSTGFGGDEYFSWHPDSMDPPDENVILKHAERLCEVCDWLVTSEHVQQIRLVGHSAGANICNFTTHRIADRLGTAFQFSQLILLSPPVPHPKGQDNVFKQYYELAFPKIACLRDTEFLNFRPTHDNVLNGVYDKRTHYKHPDIKTNTVENIREVYKAQRETVVPAMTGINHWEPCAIATWNRENLWSKVAPTKS